jgi:hypothetical protein
MLLPLFQRLRLAIPTSYLLCKVSKELFSLEAKIPLAFPYMLQRTLTSCSRVAEDKAVMSAGGPLDFLFFFCVCAPGSLGRFNEPLGRPRGLFPPTFTAATDVRIKSRCTCKKKSLVFYMIQRMSSQGLKSDGI